MYAIIVIFTYFVPWLFLSATGHPWLGMVAGLALTLAARAIMWRIEFKTWRFWK